MKAKDYKKKIIEAMKAVNTYRPEFEMAILALSDILEKRDDTLRLYEESGGEPVYGYNDGKSPGMNAYLKVYCDLNAHAIKLWKDLGLTPAGLKQIHGDSAAETKQTDLISAIRSLSGGK